MGALALDVQRVQPEAFAGCGGVPRCRVPRCGGVAGR